MQTRNAGVVSSIPPCVKMGEEGNWNDLMKSTYVGETQSPVSGSSYARNRVWDAVQMEDIQKSRRACPEPGDFGTADVRRNQLSDWGCTCRTPHCLSQNWRSVEGW